MRLIITLFTLISSVLLLSFIAPVSNEKSQKAGKEIFEKKCTSCHGADGTKGRWGAKNLKVSVLPDADLLRIISNGKRIMPAWKNSLTENEIELVIIYIRTLRK